MFQKIIGIIIIVALAGSMIAAAIIYMPESSQINPDITPTDQPTFNYEISFETQVIQELESIRIAAETSEINKTKIDSEIQNVEGISRIQFSEFRNVGDGNWFYFAEITLRKNFDLEKIVEDIFKINYFDGEKQAMKKVSISTPQENIDLNSSDLNMSRKFVFEYPTTFTIASIETLPGDKIIVEGTISLKGNTIVFIELVEIENKTDLPEYYYVDKEFELLELGEELFFEVKGDFNADYYSEQISLLENSYAFPYNDSLIGQTNIEDKEFVKNLFEDFELELNRAGKIFVEDVFVEELDETFSFNDEIEIQISDEKTVGEIINVELTISKTRKTLGIAGSKEIK